MKRGPFKKVKLEEKIKDDLNALLRFKTSDTRLQFVSISRVELSTDYEVAKVYWDTFDASKRGDAKKAIEGLDGKMRSTLGKSLKMKKTPDVEILYDSQYEDEHKIERILAEEAGHGRGVGEEDQE